MGASVRCSAGHRSRWRCLAGGIGCAILLAGCSWGRVPSAQEEKLLHLTREELIFEVVSDGPHLLEAGEDASYDYPSVYAFIERGTAANAQLLDLLVLGRPMVRLIVLSALVEINDPEHMLPVLIDLLSDTSRLMRYRAASYLKVASKESKPAMPVKWPPPERQDIDGWLEYQRGLRAWWAEQPEGFGRGQLRLPWSPTRREEGLSEAEIEKHKEFWDLIRNSKCPRPSD